MRGAFYLPKYDLLIPNQLTRFGIQNVMFAAFKDSPLFSSIDFGLGSQRWEPTLHSGMMGEPTSANGYARQTLDMRSSSDWPTAGGSGEEIYIQSRTITFTATGPYSRTVSRLFAVAGTTVLCVSAPLANAPVQIDDPGFDTNYRLYMS